MIVFDCQICRTKLSAQEAQMGQMVRCPQCRATMKVPTTVAAVEELATAGSAAGSVAGGAVGAARPNFNVPGAATAFRSAGSGGKRYGFNCGYCSSRLEATEAMSGQEGQCPTCGSTITIPIQDRYGRLIDPKTRQIIKPDPHPVHAYAAAGERAPKIYRQNDGKQVIRCARCSTVNSITANNCKACGMPFTMEGTGLEASGASNGFCVASLVLGVIGLPTFCAILPSVLAIVFGILGMNQVGKSGGERGGRGMAIAGIACGACGCLISFYWYVLR